MEIAVCDDNLIDRNTAAQMLRQCMRMSNSGGGITCFSNGIELLYEAQDGKIFDAVFLDIYMDKMMGMDVARRLRASGYNGKIIFMTATSGFAVESYEVKAFGYILKPVTFEKIERITRELLADFDSEVYHLRHRSEIINIDYNNIVFVESCNSKCLLHCTSGEIHTVYKRLCDIEDELCDSRFLRCHQSYLINMNHIVYADKSFRTDNGETVLIRQKNLKEIRDIYYSFLK